MLRHILAHLDDHVVEAGVEDIDFLHEFSDTVHKASRVAVGKIFGTERCLRQQDHKLPVRVMVEKRQVEQVHAAAVRAGPEEHLPAPDLFL